MKSLLRKVFKPISKFDNVGENFAWELYLFHLWNKWKDEITFFDFSFDFCYGDNSDHSPSFQILLIILNLKIIDFNFYNMYHTEKEEEDKWEVPKFLRVIFPISFEWSSKKFKYNWKLSFLKIHNHYYGRFCPVNVSINWSRSKEYLEYDYPFYFRFAFFNITLAKFIVYDPTHQEEM